jgi:CHASE3 domain sensor protein
LYGRWLDRDDLDDAGFTDCMKAEGATVGDEQVIKLLEEIRDLQKLHVENYKDALKNQQQAIDIQKQAVRRQKITLVVIGGLLLVFLIFLAWSSHPTG